LGEDIRHGQHVERFAVDGWDGTAWRQLAAGTTIGYSRILVLDSPASTRCIRLRIVQSRATPRLAALGLYRSAAPDAAG
jgi:alpha-L-fucosidase